MLRIGLTGGIASGKSTVSVLFSEFGVPVIDADMIARELVVPGRPLLKKIISAFGDEILDTAGAINRDRLRQMVFDSKPDRERLETIMHPAIMNELLRRTNTLRTEYCILSIPLLVEADLESYVDRVLLIDIPESLQLDRLGQRPGISPEQARSILAAQSNRKQRLAIADDVIDNTGSMPDLQQEIKHLHSQYLELAAT